MFSTSASALPDYVKIGYADDIAKRLKQLNRSECIPFAFRVYATYEVNSRLANTNPAGENLRRKVAAIDPQKCEFMTIKKFLMLRYNRTDYDILVMDECSMVSNSDMADIIDKVSCEIMILVGDTYQIESITFGNWFSMAKYFVPAYAWNELVKPYRTEDEHLLEFWRKVRNLDDDLTEYIVNHRYSTSLDSSVFDKKSEDEIILCWSVLYDTDI